jgi:hypothetical protein
LIAFAYWFYPPEKREQNFEKEDTVCNIGGEI